MDEHHMRVIMDGVIVKRENRALKENPISPELSMQRMALHARDQLIQIVSIKIRIVARGPNEGSRQRL
jgi:hypothetical protein